MKTRYLLLLAFTFGLFTKTQAQCTECTPDESCTSDVLFPMLCPEVLPDATAGEYYETFLTFFLPPELEDPGSGLVVSLNVVTISQVTGLPFGLTFQLSEEDNTYNPSQGQQYGCATLCGTPLLPGEYLVTVFVAAEVSVFGINQTANESFSQALTVLPGNLGNPSFSIDNFASCDVLDVNAVALIDGSPGITAYAWDFGNGQQSDIPTPATITYSEPGDYTISLVTSISNYNLESISVSSFQDSWSGDIEEFNNSFSPDPYFILTDGNGAVVYNGATIDGVFSATWSDINVVMDNPPYTVSFYDEDTISNDDFLGSGTIGVNNGVANFSAGGTSGFAVVGITAGPQFENEEIVSVFPQPNTDLSFDDLSSTLSLDDPELDSFTWFFMGDTIQGENSSTLVLDAPGVYFASTTNVYGCVGTSEEYILCPSPSIIFDEEFDVLLTQPGNASYQWSYNGLPVPDSDTDTLPFMGLGNYAVEVSTDYGCQEESEVYTLLTDVKELGEELNFQLYPNPANNEVRINITRGSLHGAQVNVMDLQGRIVISIPSTSASSKGNLVLETQSLSTGTYIVQISKSGRISNQKLVVNH